MSKHCHALLFFVDPTAANSWQVMDPSEDYFDDDCELFDSDSDVSVIRTVEPRPEPDGDGLWSHDLVDALPGSSAAGPPRCAGGISKWWGPSGAAA